MPIVLALVHHVHSHRNASSRYSTRIRQERVVGISLRWWIGSVEGRAVVRVERRTLCKSPREIWIRKIPATEDDGIRFVRFKFGHRIVPVEPTCGEELDAPLQQGVAEAIQCTWSSRTLDSDFGFHPLVGSVCRKRIKLRLLVENSIKSRLNPDI